MSSQDMNYFIYQNKIEVKDWLKLRQNKLNHFSNG